MPYRTYLILPILTATGIAALTALTPTNVPKTRSPIRISETVDEGFEAFKIETAAATYYYQKEAGGLSSLVDRDGHDWIGWRDLGPDEYPKGCGGDYRGIPNSIADGTTHPGFRQCTSRIINANTIESVSKNGRWTYRWAFSTTTPR
jgi:hypothetical protein